MEIKRKYELLETISRRYVIRQSASTNSAVCAACGKAALTAGQSAMLFGITQRHLFQIIETSALHYVETEIGEVLICITSLAEFLRDGKQKDYTGVSNHQ